MTSIQSGLAIRPFRAGDDLDAELDLRHRAFGPADLTREQWLDELHACIADARLLGVWDGAELVGAVRYYSMLQWWHGRAVPMAGVAGVKVAPEARRRGIGRAMMRALLATLAERGYPLSVLYPATARLYRSLGWEIAGGYYLAEIPARSLTSLAPPDPHAVRPGGADDAAANGAGGAAGEQVRVRRAGPEEAAEVIAVLGDVHRRNADCGPSTRDADGIARWLARPEMFAYLADDGFLAYRWDGSDADLLVQVIQAASAQTTRALWGIVGSHASVARTVRAAVGPDDPVGWLLGEADLRFDLHEAWMLRVVSAAAAIEGRGFPPAVRVSVPLLLADSEIASNAGPRTLVVADGRGSLRPGLDAAAAAGRPADPVVLGPRGVAALFAGVPAPTLRRAGLMTGGSERTDADLAAAFAARSYSLDHF
ncbi:MAG: GNAT family N-acetyltransferase [Streptosporangiaceae bacterium]